LKKIGWISFLVVICIVAVAATAWVYKDNLLPSSKERSGLTLTSQIDHSMLLSDVDVVSFNLTSQEIILTEAASQRLIAMTDSLYNFTNVYLLKLNGEEIYQGIFRSVVMSALPAPPKVAILYPSFDFSSNTENDHAIRLFYPSFQPPSDLSEMNEKIAQYFQDAGKLII
jgi:hypothetical protein